MRKKFRISSLVVSIGLMAAFSPGASTFGRQPMAKSACHHADRSASSPCIVGNVFVVCGYQFGSCSTEGKGIHCKVSAELGQVITRNGVSMHQKPHKLVSCVGSATILKAFLVKRDTIPKIYQNVVKHGRHRLKVVMYFLKLDRGVDIMAQH